MIINCRIVSCLNFGSNYDEAECQGLNLIPEAVLTKKCRMMILKLNLILRMYPLIKELFDIFSSLCPLTLVNTLSQFFSFNLSQSSTLFSLQTCLFSLSESIFIIDLLFSAVSECLSAS